MKKRSVLALLLLSLFHPGFFSGTGTIAANTAYSVIECEAPPPSYLKVTNVTPTSISLAWGLYSAPPPTYYFKLEGYDNTSSTALPTVYTTAWNYTYTGLTPGHNYTFSLSASYCEEGEFGTKIYANSNSGIIITDFIVEIQGCSPTTNRTITEDQPFNIGVQSSTTVPMQTLTNPYTAQFTYNGNTCTFSLAFVPSTSTVYKEVEGPFTFTAQNNGADAVCKYDTIEVFKVSYLASRGAAASMVGLKMEFKEPVSNFTYCGDFAPPVMVGNSSEGPKKTPEDAASADRFSIEIIPGNTISPNPFSASATLQYTLAEDSPVKIGLYDAMGRLVRDVEATTVKAAGNHVAVVDGAGLPDGPYFLHLQTARNREIFTLIKRE